MRYLFLALMLCFALPTAAQSPSMDSDSYCVRHDECTIVYRDWCEEPMAVNKAVADKYLHGDVRRFEFAQGFAEPDCVRRGRTPRESYTASCVDNICVIDLM